MRQHCAICGAQMSYQFDGWPDETHLYAASLDDPSQFQPMAHFHYAERVPWIAIKDGLPKYAASAEGADPIRE